MSGEKAEKLTSQKPAESIRGRSTIDFPYFDQDDAVKVAEAVRAVGGTSCDWDQLAAQMKHASSGGGFRLRVMAGRTFGLLDYDRGSVTLTELGIKIVDQKFVRAARVESFLAVPLFKAVFEKLKGSMLPPAAAIERSMETLGVAPKTKEKARQVFMRSAKQAGFFEIDQNRLTYPPNTVAAPSATKFDEQNVKGDSAGTGGGGTGDGDLHPFIKGLLGSLPQPGADWPAAARAKWLQAAANIFDLIYKSVEDGKSVQVTVSKDEGQ